ncbi:uncharacterized protein [Ptychodera flava]|uniref:uncharacterized protein n=1 Tax=Ptychodera flava TaxID=63121 RepID=UPI003969DBB0
MAYDSDEQNAADLPKSTLTYKILKRWKASELKAFLKDRNMKTSGRKDDLIDRICLVEGLNRSGDGSDRSCAELEDKRLKILPSELQEEYNSLRFDRIQENWTRDLKYIPTDFGMEKMKEYLIYSTDKSYDGDSMRQYKTLRSYRLFHEGYVQNIEANVQTRFLIVRAQVMPSESTDRLYRAYVCLNKTTGDIYGGKCRCVAGLGEACSHMGALLFSLENYIALGMIAMPSTTCTEKLCTWKKPASLKVTPKPISEVQMLKIEYGKTISVMTNKTRENYDCRIPEHREVSRPHLKELYQKMSQCNQSCSWVKFYDEDHIVNENAKKLSQHGQSSVPNDVPDVTVKEKNTTEQIIT